MGRFIYCLPRVLAILVTLFFSVFILEFFTPGFGWQAGLSHLIPALILLTVTITAWKWPLVGGLIFAILGCFCLFFFSITETWPIGGTVLLIGLLFVIEGLKHKKINKK